MRSPARDELRKACIDVQCLMCSLSFTPNPLSSALEASAIKLALSRIVSIALSGPLRERGILVQISKSAASSIQVTPHIKKMGVLLLAHSKIRDVSNTRLKGQ